MRLSTNRPTACPGDEGPATPLVMAWLDLRHNPDATPPDPADLDLLHALTAGDRATETRRALTVLAWERVHRNADLACTLADVEALWDHLEAAGDAPLPRPVVRHVIADAWVDAIAADRASPAIDAISGLHTVGYLTGRITELDRIASEQVASLVLLAARWREPESAWTRLGHILQVAEALRGEVRPEATLGQYGTHVSFALVPDDMRARVECGALNKALNSTELSTADITVDLIALPEDRSYVTELIVRLQDGSTVGDKSGPIGRFPGGLESLD